MRFANLLSAAVSSRLDGPLANEDRKCHSNNITREGVDVQNDVYAILVDSIRGNAFDERGLVAVLELAPGNLDPSSVRGRDAENI